MEIFLSVLNCVLPVFIYMAVGYGARLCGVIRTEDVPRFNKLAFRIFLPMVIFYNIYTTDISTFRGGMMIYSVIGTVGEFLLALLPVFLLVKQRTQKGVVIHAVFRSNFSIVGLAILGLLSVDGDLSSGAMIAAVGVPLVNILGVTALELYSDKRVSPKEIVIDILKNPLLDMAVLGIIFAVFRLKLPEPVEKVAAGLNRAASPLMMVLMGAYLRPEAIKGNLKITGLTCVMRLVICPLVFTGIAIMLGFRGIELAALTVLFAAPAASSTFPMAQEMGGDAELAGNIVMASTLFCPLTLFLWCFVLRWFGLI